MRYKVALMIFSEGRAREDVYKQRKPMQDREVNKFIATLNEDIGFYIPACNEIRSRSDIKTAVMEIDKSDVTTVIFYTPIFISPALVAHAANLTIKPSILMGNKAGDTFSQLSFLAAGGAVDQTGARCRRIPGDISDSRTKDELLRYLKAVDVCARLKGSTFGCFGGRSLGISTGTADPAQWERLFCVDTEHVDQYELVRRAQAADPKMTGLYVDWVKRSYGKVCFKEGRFDDERLEKMVRSYLAAKSIIRDYELDFVGIKCQPEMSNGYVLQCLNVQMLNDPYDAEGPKEPVVCSCEADSDGALTMQLLKLISGGKPTALQDIFYVDDKIMVLANCGSMASFFSNLSDCPEDNLKDVFLQPHAFGEAGGAATQFVCASGPFTYARLYRKNGEYEMAILNGNTVKKPREALKDYSWYRPTSFVELSINSREFMREYGSNHIHCVQGNYTNDLVELCKYKGIRYTLF
ncbi:MAG: hypothetical protein MUP52_00755 [Candidatus Aminicenantes bacterium]|nr:hypothetical protein [Candidatus Aminicenantes bacterium]